MRMVMVLMGCLWLLAAGCRSHVVYYVRDDGSREDRVQMARDFASCRVTASSVVPGRRDVIGDIQHRGVLRDCMRGLGWIEIPGK